MADVPAHMVDAEAPDPNAVQAVLVNELGRLSAESKERLSNGFDRAYVEEELVKLRRSKKWIVSLGAVMVVIAIALPVFRLHAYILETDPMTSYMLMGQIALWSSFAAVQAAIPVYLYLNWKRRRTIFRALHAFSGLTLSEDPSTQVAEQVVNPSPAGGEPPERDERASDAATNDTTEAETTRRPSSPAS